MTKTYGNKREKRKIQKKWWYKRFCHELIWANLLWLKITLSRYFIWCCYCIFVPSSHKTWLLCYIKYIEIRCVIHSKLNLYIENGTFYIVIVYLECHWKCALCVFWVSFWRFIWHYSFVPMLQMYSILQFKLQKRRTEKKTDTKAVFDKENKKSRNQLTTNVLLFLKLI